MLEEDKLLNKAIALQNNNQIYDAISLYKQIISISPKNIQALRYLALSYIQVNEMDLAIPTFLKALAIENDPIIHMNLGNVYKQLLNNEKAIFHYNEAIKINPNYAKAYNNLAGLYAGINDFSKSLIAYKNAIHADPSFTLAHLNLGILFFNHQKLEFAEVQFNNVLAIDESNILANFYLGLIKLNNDSLNEAFDIFKSIILIDNSHVESLVNLGVISLKQNNAQLAIDYFTKALLVDETNIEARNNLAATFIHNDLYENALQYYKPLLKEYPNDIEYLYNAGVAYMGLGQINDATQLFENALRLDSNHFGALSNLAVIKLKNSDRVSACNLLERALAIKPDDKTTKFMLAAISQSEKEIEYCPSYINDLFNHYAIYYDKHMKENLRYTLPQKIFEILHNFKISNIDKALDLGCGTGLSGEVLKLFCKELIGIDISKKMLEIAASKKIYDNLIEAEAIDFLEQDLNIYSLIVAADVLPYLGCLDKLFANIKLRIEPSGIFIFSIEISANLDWHLQETIRYCHSPHYIAKLCDKYGFAIKHQEKTAARKQDAKDLDVMLYVVEMVC